MTTFTVRSFIVGYLKDTAIITLLDNHGNIFYEGDVASCSREKTAGYYVESITGLGSLDDIIITCYKNKEK